MVAIRDEVNPEIGYTTQVSEANRTVCLVPFDVLDGLFLDRHVAKFLADTRVGNIAAKTYPAILCSWNPVPATKVADAIRIGPQRSPVDTLHFSQNLLLSTWGANSRGHKALPFIIHNAGMAVYTLRIKSSLSLNERIAAQSREAIQFLTKKIKDKSWAECLLEWQMLFLALYGFRVNSTGLLAGGGDLSHLEIGKHREIPKATKDALVILAQYLHQFRLFLAANGAFHTFPAK